MSIQKVWNHSNGHNLASLVNDVANVSILEPDHILPIDLKQVVLDQEAIPSSWGVDDNGGNFTLLELKTDMTRRVFVKRKRALERSRNWLD